MKKWILILMLVALLCDFSYSFIQHLSAPLDGDMAGGIVPDTGVQKVLNDPFGISVISKNDQYPNPNRFFAHWSFYTYFNTIPLRLQYFVSPILSVYLSCAIAKISIQLGFILLLAFYITGTKQVFTFDFIFACILITPLFQTNGYRSSMGIIDVSITYTFFYALPSLVVLWFYLPFFRAKYHGIETKRSSYKQFFTFCLLVFASFNGALNPAIILIVSCLYLFFILKPHFISLDARFLNTGKSLMKSIAINELVLILTAGIICLYSIYISFNNTIFSGEPKLSVLSRFMLLPQGLFNIFSQKIGLILLLLSILGNCFILKKMKTIEAAKIVKLFGWIGIFAVTYLLLLPFGGFKSYRPFLIRYDTFMPVTICFIFMFGISSLQIFKALVARNKIFYAVAIFVFTLIFSNADKPNFDQNKSEILALKQIAQSEDKLVGLKSEGTILSWKKITDPIGSRMNGKLLKRWNITKDEKMYFQK